MTPTPTPPASLPVPEGRPEEHRRVQALGIAHEEGWIVYLHPQDNPGGGRSYVVDVPLRDGTVFRRTLLASEVLPWLLGIADSYGQASLIAYRNGLEEE